MASTQDISDGLVEKQNPRKGTESRIFAFGNTSDEKFVEKQNPRKGTETRSARALSRNASS